MPAIWIQADGCWSGNAWLNQAQMEANADRFYYLCSQQGWSLPAVAAMAGNSEVEATLNPGIWQGLDEGDFNGGYGFFQWTPASKYIDWCTENNYNREYMTPVITRLLWEIANNEQYYPTSSYPESFTEFLHYQGKTQTDIEYLAAAWCYNYERPADPDVPQRQADAVKWFTYFQGHPPTPGPGRQPGMPTWMLLRKNITLWR